MAKEKKITRKERILRFVEEQGGARYSEIIKFIVNELYGKGENLWEKGYYFDRMWINGCERVRRVNSYRGTYSSAFIPGKGHLMLGKEYLEKHGRYYLAIRNGVHKPYPVKWRPTRKSLHDIIVNLESGRVTGLGVEVPMIKLHVHNTDPIDKIYDVNEDCVKMRGYLTETNTGRVLAVEQEPIISEPHLTVYNRDLDVSIVTNNDNKIVAIMEGAPLEGFKREERRIETVKKKDDVPGYCRWCGRKLHPSHFEEIDDRGNYPNYCHWCGHTL